MPKEIVIEAATIEQAKAEAAAALGAEQSELKFEVLAEPQKKTFGLFGGSPARVRAVKEASPAENAVEYLCGILEKMGVDSPVVTVKEQNERGCILTLEGEGLGVVIGRRGETLDALQYLSGLVANRVRNSYYRVTLDTGNFRKKREQSLTGLAKKIAHQAVRTGRKTSLEPMNPYERRIIHTAVHEVPGADSWSEGIEGNRYVIIGAADGAVSGSGAVKNNRPRGRGKPGPGRADRSEKPRDAAIGQQRPERAERPERPARPENSERPERAPHSERRPGDSVTRPEREVRQFVPRTNPLPTADGATPPSKTQSDVENSSSLYGRIDL